MGSKVLDGIRNNFNYKQLIGNMSFEAKKKKKGTDFW